MPIPHSLAGSEEMLNPVCFQVIARRAWTRRWIQPDQPGVSNNAYHTYIVSSFFGGGRNPIALHTGLFTLDSTLRAQFVVKAHFCSTTPPTYIAACTELFRLNRVRGASLKLAKPVVGPDLVSA